MIGKLIDDYCKKHNITASEFAEMVGMSHVKVSRLMRNKVSMLSGTEIERLAYVFARDQIEGPQYNKNKSLICPICQSELKILVEAGSSKDGIRVCTGCGTKYPYMLVD